MERSIIRLFLYFCLTTFSLPIFGANRNSMRTIQLKDYVVHYKQYNMVVIDKNTLEIHLFQDKRFVSANEIRSNGNLLVIKSNNRSSTLDIGNRLLQSKKYQMQIIYIISILFCIVLFLIIRFKLSVKRSSTSEPEIMEKHNYYDKIAMYASEILRTHEIDELFEIEKLSYDSRKLKRHRLIQEINKKHPDLIQRVKDKEDQRKYLYIIKKQKE
jgi:hypothetical protein